MVSPGASAGVKSQLCSAPCVCTLPKVEGWIDISRPRFTKVPNDLHVSEK